MLAVSWFGAVSLTLNQNSLPSFEVIAGLPAAEDDTAGLLAPMGNAPDQPATEFFITATSAC